VPDSVTAAGEQRVNRCDMLNGSLSGPKRLAQATFNLGARLTTRRKTPAIVGVAGASATEGVGWTGPTPPNVSESSFEMVKGCAVLGPDEFCGEGCLTGQARRMATAVAMTECEIVRLEKAAMIRVLHEEPAFSEMFIAHLLARTIRVEEDLVDQLFNSSEKRLARSLLLLALRIWAR
jgi:CRP-like cAMP-binding protein